MGKSWFEEKTDQVDPNSLIAFGIKCFSRYGKAKEMVDMINFREQCTLKGVNKYITILFYDSKSCCCNIEYDKAQTIKNHAHAIIHDIADHTLGQHDMDDCIGGYYSKEIPGQSRE